MPMTNAPIGGTNPDAGVTATRPATRPDANPRAVGLPRWTHSAAIQLKAAAAAATCDAVKADPANPLLANALPPLNPNHPNHSKPAPTKHNTILFGWIACSG
jgi:hypothetical protein